MLVIFADLDGLKQINDRLGHQAGDRALFEFATLLRATFRERDLVAGWAGMNSSSSSPTPPAGARRAAWPASRAASRSTTAGGGETSPSPSRPASPPSTRPSPSRWKLLSQADARMYAEKRRRKDEARAL